MDLSATRRGYEDNGDGGGGYLCPPTLEYCFFSVHCHLADPKAMSRGGEKDGGVGVNKMVVTVRTGNRLGMVGYGYRDGD